MLKIPEVLGGFGLAALKYSFFKGSLPNAAIDVVTGYYACLGVGILWDNENNENGLSITKTACNAIFNLATVNIAMKAVLNFTTSWTVWQRLAATAVLGTISWYSSAQIKDETYDNILGEHCHDIYSASSMVGGQALIAAGAAIAAQAAWKAMQEMLKMNA